MLFAEVVEVVEEGDPEGLGGKGVVRSGVSEKGVALREKGLGEELAVVAKANYAYFELVVATGRRHLGQVSWVRFSCGDAIGGGGGTYAKRCA